MASSDQPRGKGGRFISKEEAENVTEEDLPKLVHKSSKMTGALKDLKEAKEDKELDKPLISLSLNNPIAWFMKWLKSLKKRQTTTITFRLGVPLIALPILIAALAGVIFSLSTVTKEKEVKPTPVVLDESKTSKVGSLRLIEEDEGVVYYLILSSDEVMKLEVEEGMILDALDGKRVLATGLYIRGDNILKVERISDLEILPDTPEPLPAEVIEITPAPTLIPTLEITPSATAPVPSM